MKTDRPFGIAYWIIGGPPKGGYPRSKSAVTPDTRSFDEVLKSHLRAARARVARYDLGLAGVKLRDGISDEMTIYIAKRLRNPL